MNKNYEVFYPEKYSENDSKAIDALRENIPSDMFGKKLEPGKPTMVREVTLADFKTSMESDPYNPLYYDLEYSTKVKGTPAYFPMTVGDPSGQFPGAFSQELGTEWLYSNDGGDAEYFTPAKLGDKLSFYTDEQSIIDITPKEGYNTRIFRLIGRGSVYNQDGELISKGNNYGKNGYRRDLDNPDAPLVTVHFTPDPGKKYNTSLGEWVTPPTYDEEGFDRVLELYRSELVRGEDILYWDDVNVGDEPAPVSSGPVTVYDLIRGGVSGMNKIDMVKNAREAEGLIIDEYGCYHHMVERHYGPGGTEGHIGGPVGGWQRTFILRMLTNYMSNDGFIRKLVWYQPNKHMLVETGFDKAEECFNEVPALRGKTIEMWGSIGENFIAKGYVTRKYEENGEHLIDLVCYLEGFAGNLGTPMRATLRLPVR